MSFFRYTYLFIIVLLFFSCNTIKVGQDLHYKTTTKKVIGGFSEHKTYVLEKDYNEIAFPIYNAPLRLTVTKTSNKNVLKDSIITSFIKFEIADKIAVLEALKSEKNKPVKEYLKNNSNTQLVSSIAISFKEKDQKQLLSATEVFLEQNTYKNYIFKAYNNGVLTAEINLNNGNIISYQLASACWKQNKQFSIEIINFVEPNNKCSNKSYKNPNRANRRINYYKL